MGSATPAAPAVTGVLGWSFTGWLPAPTATVAGSTAYVAQWDGTNIRWPTRRAQRHVYSPADDGLFYGADTPGEPSVTGQPDWVFTGWLPARAASVTQTQTYTAQWTLRLVQGPVVFYHVCGGGGNTNGIYNHDFIVIKNIGTSPVNLDGWSIQYTSYDGVAWISFGPLSGTIDPDDYYVIQGFQGTNSPPQADLPYFHASFPLLAIDRKEYKVRLETMPPPLWISSVPALRTIFWEAARRRYRGRRAGNKPAVADPKRFRWQTLIRGTTSPIMPSSPLPICLT